MKTSNKTKNGFTIMVVVDEKIFETAQDPQRVETWKHRNKNGNTVDVWVLNTVGLLPISDMNWSQAQ